MIEEIIFDFLTSVLSAPVYIEKPSMPPASYIVIERTGTNITNRITAATINIQSFAAGIPEAANLNEQVIAAMENAAALDSISHVSLNSAYNFTDTDTKQPRYQAVFYIVYYKE